MTPVEILIFIMLALMGLPDLCKKIGRPAILYNLYLLLGMFLGPFLNQNTQELLTESGRFGFILLLFVIGLEIDLPQWSILAQKMKWSVAWTALQFPIIAGLSYFQKPTIQESLVVGAALTACSVGVSYIGLKHYPGLSESLRNHILLLMVLLEVQGVILIAFSEAFLKHGVNFTFVLQIGLTSLAIYLVSVWADRLTGLLKLAIEKTTHWRVHFIVLFVLVVAAAGERMGLSAAKTAFFLGLFMSGVEHRGLGIETVLEPVGQKFLIPIFFVGLGTRIDLFSISLQTMAWAVLTTFILFGVRKILHQRLLATGGDVNTYLLFCPNITMVAITVEILAHYGSPSETIGWLLITGLLMTMGAIFKLPPIQSDSLEEGQVPLDAEHD